MIVLLTTLLGAGVLATTDVVTLSAAMRALIYAAPLVLLLVLIRGEWVLKAAYACLILNAVATVAGAPRSTSSLIALIPATLFSAYGIQLATTRRQA